MNISLENKIAIIMILSGGILLIFTFTSFLAVFPIAIFTGGCAIFLIYYERKWIKLEYLKISLLATLLFAVIYGILEYMLFDSKWNNWFKLSKMFPTKYGYFIFMALLNFSLVFFLSKKSLALSILSIPLFSVNEDLSYWLTKSVHTGRYIFPVPNWFDLRFDIFGLGEPIPFFPYWPRFYFLGWILIAILLIILFNEFNDKKFIIIVGIYCGCSFLCLLLIPPNFNRALSNFNYLISRLFLPYGINYAL